VLLGTSSFWEGVDVPGEALSAVVIDRLPFDTLNDPIVNAINAANPKAFHEYMVPRAVVTLRQGMGRLIRTKTDRGVVVLLDPRVRTKPYGKRFLKDWPPGLNITMSLDDAADFLTSLPMPAAATGT
jgi:ATP-dependent DNA helicase DinG